MSIKDSNIKEEDILWGEEHNQIDGSSFNTIDIEMIEGGIIEIAYAGYGSAHDGERIIFAICDACIEENLADATLLYRDSYSMPTPIGDNAEGKAEKSRVLYRRRSRLDSIID